ncbi:MAG TPA: chemotaxis protein CheR, partial [Candidatus Marinimicrobia bacterium]|nr:chemotaxis protein CheR [Candidatus Neomarinimicrobiota bacterium]
MTTGAIPIEMLTRISKYIAAHFGLNFPRERYKELEKGLVSAAREMGCHDVKACIQEILSAELSSEQIEILASYLTIGETYFHREHKSFDAFRNHILPELINSRKNNERKIRIWSAACSSGEEAYTIAIIIREMLNNIQDWNVTILASDINIRALKKARQGIYTEWSFRHVPPGFKEKYFKKRVDNKYEILPEIKEMVSFS